MSDIDHSIEQAESTRPISENPEQLKQAEPQQDIPFYRRKAFQALGGVILVGGAFGFGLSLNESENEDATQTENTPQNTEQEQPLSPPDTEPESAEPGISSDTESPESEQPNILGEDFDKNYWLASWASESDVVQGPPGSPETHRAMSNLTADLLGRIASTRQAETEQEIYLNSRVQTIQNATYFIEKDNTILEIKDPIVYGFFYEGDGRISYSWQADGSDRDNFAVFYKNAGEWNSFVLSEHDDARWFSDGSSKLIAAAYADDGPIIREGVMSQASLQNDGQPILIDTGGFGPISVPNEPNTYDSREQIIDLIQSDPDRRPNGLLSINSDIKK